MKYRLRLKEKKSPRGASVRQQKEQDAGSNRKSYVAASLNRAGNRRSNHHVSSAKQEIEKNTKKTPGEDGAEPGAKTVKRSSALVRNGDDQGKF